MQIICRTCRRPLNRSDLPGGENVWIHGFGQAEDGDHPADPTLGDPHARCDMCNGEPVVALLPVTGTVHLAPMATSDDPWALCATCRTLISVDSWDDLLDHAITALHASATEAGITLAQLTEPLRRIHTQLRAQASGPPLALSAAPAVDRVVPARAPGMVTPARAVEGDLAPAPAHRAAGP
uniref:hypothetical protein n=1 Tax=Frankia gtarii TaxID=2950102 RepID=UPI0021C00549